MLLALCFLFSITIAGQVTVGSGETSKSGALLDLKQNNNVEANSTKGLLLPRVLLTAEDVMLATGQDNPIAHTGLLVYNVGDENCPFNPLRSGVYTWVGSKWVLLGNKGVSNTEVQSTIKAGTEDVTNGEHTVALTQQLNLTASATGAKTFSWYLEGVSGVIHEGARLTKTLNNATDFGKYTVVMTDGPECGNKIRVSVDVKQEAVCAANVTFVGEELKNQSNALMSIDPLQGGYDITGVTSIRVTPVMAATSENENYYEIRKGSATGPLVASGTNTSLVITSITATSIGDYYILTRDNCGEVRTDVFQMFTLIKKCSTTLKIERLVVTDQNKTYLQYQSGTSNFELYSGVNNVIITPIAKVGTDVATRYYLRKGSPKGNNLAEGIKTLTTTDIPKSQGAESIYYVVPVDKCGGERVDLAYSFTLIYKICTEPGIGIDNARISPQNIANFKNPNFFKIWDSVAPNAQPATIVGGAYIMPYNSLRIETASAALTKAFRFEIHKDDGTILNPNNGRYVGASDRWDMTSISSGPSIDGTYTMYMFDTCGNIMAQVTIRLKKQ